MPSSNANLLHVHERIDRLREQLRIDFTIISQRLESLQKQIDALRHQNIPPK